MVQRSFQHVGHDFHVLACRRQFPETLDLIASLRENPCQLELNESLDTHSEEPESIMSEPAKPDGPPITQLSKSQRRVLGVLVEKAFTTPEYYPLTLKAVTTSCNQKSNRHPIVNYSEDDVLDVLDQLRELRLVAVVHTGTGRTERFRHYMRRQFTMTEPQLAILIELLLRGRQSAGELRSRASRMVSVDGLQELRDELTGLIEMKLVQTSGSLERRGVEIDHNLYQPAEDALRDTELGQMVTDSGTPFQPALQATTHSQLATEVPPTDNTRIEAHETSIEQLRLDSRKLRDELEGLKAQVSRLTDLVDQLRRDLGG